ncbi:Protein MAIN-LIKE 2 [Glycine soja]
MWCLRLKTKVLPRRRTFFCACESGLLVFERKKVFFCGSQRKKVKRFFRDSQRKKVKRFFRGIQRKKVLQIMVRTRGLGRALGTDRGRDISEDAHQVDVPRRRRLTASARRQQDVPHVSDATPEMTGAADAVHTEGVATDGSLGSPAADEGFPDGPCDPSVLTDFAEHVAHSIWSGQERLDLKLVSHGRKVDKFGRPAPEIEDMIAATGMSPLIRCSVITTDHGLISAFVERWHRETSTY